MIRCLLWMIGFGFMSVMTASGADEWPQFRGPLGNGYAKNAKIPVTFGENENVAWKVPVEGEGFSSPVISGSQLWLTTAIVEPLSEEEEQAKLATLSTNPRGIKIGGPMTLKAICFDTTSGKVIHDVICFQYPVANPKHATNSYASPSPIIEQGKLYCHFGEYGTCCIDAVSGQLAWKNQELKVDYQNGPGSSPVLWGNFLIAHYDGIDAQFVAAYDKQTGKIAWKTERSGTLDPKPDFKKAYCTPILLDIDGQTQLVSPAADWVYGYDPATGKELWKLPYGMLGFSTVPKPVAGESLFYICTSFMKSRLLAVDFTDNGNWDENRIRWSADRQVPQKPSLMLIGTELYLISDGGIATCLDATTGEQLWQERFRGQYSASPLYANGHIYYFSMEGDVTVIRAGREFQLVAENRLDGGFQASPAVIGNDLFLRTRTDLYCIKK